MKKQIDCAKKAGKCTWIAPQTHRHARRTPAALTAGPGRAPSGGGPPDDKLVKQALQ
jgi:hypothetical protein